jgi:hypothetical protein
MRRATEILPDWLRLSRGHDSQRDRGGALRNTFVSDVGLTGRYQDLLDPPPLSTVALSGRYSDLRGLPTLSQVAITGSYTDLEDLPAAAISSPPPTAAAPEEKAPSAAASLPPPSKEEVTEFVTAAPSAASAPPYTPSPLLLVVVSSPESYRSCAGDRWVLPSPLLDRTDPRIVQWGGRRGPYAGLILAAMEPLLHSTGVGPGLAAAVSLLESASPPSRVLLASFGGVTEASQELPFVPAVLYSDCCILWTVDQSDSDADVLVDGVARMRAAVSSSRSMQPPPVALITGPTASPATVARVSAAVQRLEEEQEATAIHVPTASKLDEYWPRTCGRAAAVFFHKSVENTVVK